VPEFNGVNKIHCLTAIKITQSGMSKEGIQIKAYTPSLPEFKKLL
jgi:hypothetical protein